MRSAMLDNKNRGLFLSLDHIVDVEKSDVSNINNGIVKKIIYQFQCLKSYGFQMEMFCPYERRNHRIHSIVRRLPFSGFIQYGSEYIKHACDYSFIYLRRPWYMNTDTPHFLMKMKKRNPSIKIVVEVPTYDAASSDRGEINHWHMWPLYWKNKIATKKIASCADRILTFSKDKTIYGVSTICTCNAIDPNTIRCINYINSDNHTINLVACSSMAFWHGFDRVIEGMHNYKCLGNSNFRVVFHLIGDGEELNNYRSMVIKYGLEKDVIFYGYKSGKELDDIYDHCDIAIDSMGRHRSNVYYNSSLKGKEYLAKGLPVISGVRNELDDDPDFKYYLRVPADDTPVDIDAIINFYNFVYNSGESRSEIIEQISDYASKNFSYNASFKPLVDYLLS